MAQLRCFEYGSTAELLRDAGYRTSADVTLNVPWRASFDQGFERFDDRNNDRVGRGADIVDGAIAWLERQDRSRPVFQWLHLWDPHFVYAAPEPWQRWFDPDFAGLFDLYERVQRGERTWGQVFFENDLDPRQVQHAVARYDGEILYADRMIKRFLDALHNTGRYEDSLIIFTSDHGESLGEHNLFFEHGEYLYDATLRIPLIVKLPGGRAAGRRVTAAVSILDIVPTVLAITGLGHEKLDGLDLASLLDGGGTTGRALFAQTGHSFVEENPRREVAGLAGYWTSIRLDNRKLIHIPVQSGHVYELYDIDTDPGETQNLFGSEATATKALERALDLWRNRLVGSAGEAADRSESINQLELERLRALGYAN